MGRTPPIPAHPIPGSRDWHATPARGAADPAPPTGRTPPNVLAPVRFHEALIELDTAADALRRAGDYTGRLRGAVIDG